VSLVMRTHGAEWLHACIGDFVVETVQQPVPIEVRVCFCAATSSTSPSLHVVLCTSDSHIFHAQVDPSRLASSSTSSTTDIEAQLAANRGNLSAVADKLMANIAASAPKASPIIRELAHRLQVLLSMFTEIHTSHEQAPFDYFYGASLICDLSYAFRQNFLMLGTPLWGVFFSCVICAPPCYSLHSRFSLSMVCC
jgi:hypothetical protein